MRYRMARITNATHMELKPSLAREFSCAMRSTMQETEVATTRNPMTIVTYAYRYAQRCLGGMNPRNSIASAKARPTRPPTNVPAVRYPNAGRDADTPTPLPRMADTRNDCVDRAAASQLSLEPASSAAPCPTLCSAIGFQWRPAGPQATVALWSWRPVVILAEEGTTGNHFRFPFLCVAWLVQAIRGTGSVPRRAPGILGCRTGNASPEKPYYEAG